MTDPTAPAEPIDADTDAEPRAPRRRLFWFIIALGVVVLLVDQLTKLWAVTSLTDNVNVPILGQLLSFQLVYNEGAAFSTGTGFTWIFTIVAGVVAVFVVWVSWRVRSRSWALGLGLVLGGATTHFGDRLFRAPGFGRGHVVDFINYNGYFIGNVADIAIVVGVIILLITMLRGTPMNGVANLTLPTEEMAAAKAGVELGPESGPSASTSSK
jgi:signal peptidase II